MRTRTRTRTVLRGVGGAMAVAVMFWLARAMPELLSDRDSMVPEQIDVLCARFAADEDLQIIADVLDRTPAAIRTKVDDLGLRRNSARPWPEMEDADLAQHYGIKPTSTIASELGRTCAAVYARAGVLDLTEGNAPPYTLWEIAQIRAGYDWAVPVTRLAVIVGRPLSGIISLASKLGIKHRNSPPD